METLKMGERVLVSTDRNDGGQSSEQKSKVQPSKASCGSFSLLRAERSRKETPQLLCWQGSCWPVVGVVKLSVGWW